MMEVVLEFITEANETTVDTGLRQCLCQVPESSVDTFIVGWFIVFVLMIIASATAIYTTYAMQQSVRFIEEDTDKITKLIGRLNHYFPRLKI